MKFGQLVIGILLGGLVGFGLAKYMMIDNLETSRTNGKSIDTPTTSVKWSWPDSLDALNAAPENHSL